MSVLLGGYPEFFIEKHAEMVGTIRAFRAEFCQSALEFDILVDKTFKFRGGSFVEGVVSFSHQELQKSGYDEFGAESIYGQRVSEAFLKDKEIGADGWEGCFWKIGGNWDFNPSCAVFKLE